ncbi:MAG: TolC family protein [Planctomycetaceae bacterium]
MRAILITIIAATACATSLVAQDGSSSSGKDRLLRPPIELPPAPGSAAPANIVPQIVPPAPIQTQPYETRPLAGSRVPRSVQSSVPQVSLGFADSEQESMVTPFMDRTQQLLDDDLGMESAPEFPITYEPWWLGDVSSQMRSRYVPMRVTFEEIILSAITNSPRVKALRIEPEIRKQSVVVERAQFDWMSFAEMTWNDTSDPVGNTLTTGGSPRFRDHQWSLESGVRRRTHSGAELEVSNEMGWQDNNSDFFIPAPQGTSRLNVSFTQPLLRSRGRFYNKSRIVLAQIDRGVADSETLLKLQEHLVEVSDAYWELFRARATLVQKRKLLSRASRILQRLEGRRGVDVLQRQILRARAAVTSRRSEIARSAASIRNAEARLRLLVNDPALTRGTPLEVIPADVPMNDNLVYSTPETVTVGLLTRPDIAKAIREIRTNSVRLGVSRNEMLPKLDLILSGYLSGLEDRGDIWEAKRNWLQQGEPGYSVGFKFEYPLGNRAARALVEQQQFRLRKSLFEFKNTVETSITEIELAVREARTSYTEMLSRFQSMQSAEAEADYLSERWQQLPGDDRTTAELLEDLLDAQERVATEEASFETARKNYMLALIEIKRSTGTLLATDDGLSLLNAPTNLADPIGNTQPSVSFPPAVSPAVTAPAAPSAQTLQPYEAPSQKTGEPIQLFPLPKRTKEGPQSPLPPAPPR